MTGHQRNDGDRPAVWRRIWKSVLFLDSPATAWEAQTWREAFLNGLLLVGMVLGLLVLILSVYVVVQEKAWRILVVDLLIYPVLVALYYWRSLPYKLRASVACFLLYLAGVVVIADLGPFSGGPAYLFTFCVIGGMLLGIRFAWLALALNLITVLVVALAVSRGMFPELHALMPNSARWLVAGFNFVFLNVVATISVALLVKGLERSLSQEASARGDLEQEMARRSSAEQALAEREKWYRTTFEHTGTAMVTFGADTRITMANQKFAEISGYSREEVVGMSWRGFVHPDDLASMEGYHHERRHGGRPPTSYEFRFVDRHGVVRQMINTVQLIPGTGYSIASLNDITDRTLYEQSLADSQERYKSLLAAIPDPVVAYDKDGAVHYINDAFQRTYGWTLAELEGHRIDFVPEEEAERTAKAWSHQLEEEKELLTTRRRTKDGRAIDVEICGASLRDASGNYEGALVIHRDITDRKKAEQALRESENRFRLVFQTSPDAINLSRLEDGVYVSVNQGFCDLSGYSAEEVLGRTSLEIDLWADPDDRVRLVKELQEQGAVHNLEVRFRLKDGSVRTGLVSAAIINLEDVPHLISITRDVEEWKQAELAMRESQDRARATLEASPDPIVVYDVNGHTTYVNPAFSRVFGWELSELKGARIPYIPPSEQEIASNLLRRGVKQDEPISVTSRRLTKDGRIIDVVINAARTKDASGQVSGMVVNLTDITERRNMERALQESEERYRDLVDNINDFIYTHDLEGRFTSLNRAACQTLGYQPEELIGLSVSGIMRRDLWQAFFDEYMKELQDHGSVSGLGAYFDRDGGKHYLEYRSDLVRGDGQEDFVRGSAREVTERILAEREQRKLEAQLRQAQKMEALGTLAGGIAHDFNNLLTAIMGYGELAQLAALKGKSNAAQVEHIVDAAERARDLVKQLLTFSRRSETDLKPIDLNQLVAQSVKILKHTIPKMIDLRMKLADNLDYVRADATQLEQVIINLANNACDAMPEGGRLVFETNMTTLDGNFTKQHLEMTPGTYVELMVTDTGHGMDKETLGQIFDPFFTTKEIGKGTGLGLSTVYGIVKEHEGHVYCYSEPGMGTTFKIYLPAVQLDGESLEPVRYPEPMEQVGKETILLVDDEEVIRKMGAEILESVGFKVVSVSSGEEALAIYKERPRDFDLVILDLGMPGMGGHRCLKELLSLNPAVKVLIASGYSAEGKVKDTLKEGAAGFIAKPFRFNDLLNTIRSVIDT
jgi:two-component system cell cycle sensor histidine kinase/response regulator CckA